MLLLHSELDLLARTQRISADHVQWELVLVRLQSCELRTVRGLQHGVLQRERLEDLFALGSCQHEVAGGGPVAFIARGLSAQGAGRLQGCT